jgi:hypothetical protein
VSHAPREGSTLRTILTGKGDGALYHLTTGSNNTAAGAAALWSLTTGNNNTAMGNAALLRLITGSDNTAVGGGHFLTLRVIITKHSLQMNKGCFWVNRIRRILLTAAGGRSAGPEGVISRASDLINAGS